MFFAVIKERASLIASQYANLFIVKMDNMDVFRYSHTGRISLSVFDIVRCLSGDEGYDETCEFAFCGVGVRTVAT